MDRLEDLQRKFAAHYKSERDRSEACLLDIVEILNNEKLEGEQIEAILDRMVKHYERGGV